jgi:hypothetical protein
MRTTQFAMGELYHVYNRGVDKRIVFKDAKDFMRFYKGIIFLNQTELIKSFHESHLIDSDPNDPHALTEPLVKMHAYCINPLASR